MGNNPFRNPTERIVKRARKTIRHIINSGNFTSYVDFLVRGKQMLESEGYIVTLEERVIDCPYLISRWGESAKYELMVKRPHGKKITRITLTSKEPIRAKEFDQMHDCHEETSSCGIEECRHRLSTKDFIKLMRKMEILEDDKMPRM